MTELGHSNETDNRSMQREQLEKGHKEKPTPLVV